MHTDGWLNPKFEGFNCIVSKCVLLQVFKCFFLSLMSYYKSGSFAEMSIPLTYSLLDNRTQGGQQVRAVYYWKKIVEKNIITKLTTLCTILHIQEFI